MKHYIKNIGVSNLAYANNIAPGEFYEMYDDSTGVLGIDISTFLTASQSNTGLGKDIYDGNVEYYQDITLSDMLELRAFITYLIGIEGSNITSIVNLIDGSVATTQSPGDNSNKIATTAYVDDSILLIDHNSLLGLQGGNAGEYYHFNLTNYTDLTDGGDSTLHYHASDRNRANHTGTQLASTISDFDTEVSNNTDVAANTSARHVAVTLGTANGLSLSTQQLSLAAATTGSAGAMSASDKTKLDGIATGAEVNQNAWNTISISGQSDVVADSKTDTLTLIAGTNITITTNATNDSITINNSQSLTGYALLSGATFTGIIGLPKDTRRGLSAIYNDATGDVFGMEQVSAAQTGAAAATRIFTSSVGSSTLSLGKYTSTTAFTDWLSFAATGNATFSGTVAASNLSGTNTGDQNTFSTIAVSGQSNVVADLATDTLTLAAGTGITITTNATTDTITITNSITAPNSFSTIAISGQSDVVADSSTDTLTLIAGSNITLTTNATNDSITIAASGGSSNSFSTIAISGQSDVVADSSTDTLTLVAGSGISLTTNASTDTITITNTGSSSGTYFYGYFNNSTSTEVTCTTALSSINYPFANLYENARNVFAAIGNSNEITIPTTGRYRVKAMLQINANNSTHYGITLMSGSTKLVKAQIRPASGYNEILALEQIISLNANDVVIWNFFSASNGASFDVMVLPNCNMFSLELIP